MRVSLEEMKKQLLVELKRLRGGDPRREVSEFTTFELEAFHHGGLTGYLDFIEANGR